MRERNSHEGSVRAAKNLARRLPKLTVVGIVVTEDDVRGLFVYVPKEHNGFPIHITREKP